MIFDESSHGRFHFMARSLAHASRKSTASGGNVRIKIHAGAHLELIPVNALSGRLLLGAVVPEALLPEDVAAVVEALMQAVTPSSPEVLNEFCDFGGK